MKHRITFLLVVTGIFLSVFVKAQESWPLQKCIDYALENNIQIKQQEVTVKYQENQLNQSKRDRLPNLNGQFSNNYNFGRSLTYQNTYENTNSISLSGYFGTDVTLWNGFSLQNIIKQRDLDLKATIQDQQKAKDDLILNIAAMYLEILFAEELVSVSEAQIKVTQQQIERTKHLVEAGSLARGALLEIEAQLAREELQLVNDKNRNQLSYLNLYQLLELPVEKSFVIEKLTSLSVDKVNISMNSMDVFKNAVLVRPEIMASKLRVESAQRQLAQAKGAMFPKLSFAANYYNNYNDNYLNIVTREVIPFPDQLKNNKRYGFGFTLNIPIFNGLQIRNGIANAELQIEDYQYRLQSSKNLLLKDIEQAYTNALAALKRYMASGKAVHSMEEAFRYTEEKFSVGMVNSVEYNQSKNNLTKAQSDLLQAKYEYIFRSKILDFYNGIPIKL